MAGALRRPRVPDWPPATGWRLTPLSGRVRGPGTVALTDGATAYQTAELAASGAFAFPTLNALPASALAPFETDTATGCTTTRAVSDPNALGRSADLNVTASKSGRVSPVTALTVSDDGASFSLSVVSFIYVDRPVTVTGTERCEDPDLTFSSAYNLKLTTGWNAVLAQVTETPNSIAFDVKSTTLTSGQFVFLDEALGAQSVKVPARPTLRLFR